MAGGKVRGKRSGYKRSWGKMSGDKMSGDKRSGVAKGQGWQIGYKCRKKNSRTNHN